MENNRYLEKIAIFDYDAHEALKQYAAKTPTPKTTTFVNGVGEGANFAKVKAPSIKAISKVTKGGILGKLVPKLFR